MGKYKIVQIILYSIFGVAFALCYGSFFLAIWTLPVKTLFFYFIYLYIVGSLASYWLIHQLTWPRLQAYPLKTKSLWAILCLLGGFILFYTIPFNLPAIPEASKSILVLSSWIWIAMLLFTTSVWLASRQSKRSPDLTRKPLAWYVFALPVIFFWILYLLAFWPGLMSPDSVDQWGQIITGQINDWHPAFHTLTMWLITRAWFSPAAVSFVQLIAMGCIVGWGISLLDRWMAPRWLTVFLAGIFAVSPAFGLMAIILWKDVPYGIAILALTLLFFMIVQTNGSWLKGRASWLVLGLVAALASLYRHNGAPVALGALFSLFLFYRQYWIRILASIALAYGLILGVKGPLYRIAGVEKAESHPGYEVPFFILVTRHVKDGTMLLPDERELYEQMVANARDSGVSTLTKYPGSVTRLAVNLTLRNPAETFDYLLENRAFIFQVTQPPDSVYEYPYYDIYTNPYGLKIDPKLPMVHNWLVGLLYQTIDPRWNWLIWRNAFWMYTMVFAMLIACIRTQSWKYLAISVPVLLNAIPLSFFATATAEVYRYIFPTVLVSVLVSGFLLLTPWQDPNH